MKHLIPALAIMVSAAGLGGIWPSTASADNNGDEFTYLLSADSPELGTPSGGDPDPPYLNWIFTTDGNGVPAPRFGELAALLAQPGADPRVISLSFGMDQVERVLPHGDLHYSLDISSQPNATSGGASGDALMERFDDVLADLFRTDNTIDIAQRRGPSEKSMEENSSVLPSTRFRNFPVDASAGLKGRWTGVPFPAVGENPSNIIGFDYHDPLEAWRYQDSVFFTVDRAFKLNGTWYYPFQVLTYNRVTNVLSVHEDLLAQSVLKANDVIDALSLDLEHSASINQDPSILFSLTRGSRSVIAAPNVSQADIFQYPQPYGTTTSYGDVRDLLYRTAFASGVHPIDGDIDSIVSIDPLGERRYAWVTPPGLPASSVEIVPVYAPLDEIYLYPLNHTGDPDDPILPGIGGAFALGLAQGQDHSFRVLGSLNGNPVDAGTMTVGVIPEMVPNPCGDFSVTPGPLGFTTFSFLVQPGSTFDPVTHDWELSFNGTVRKTGDDQFLEVLDSELVPGSHAFGVRLVDTTGNNSHSGYEYLAHWVDPAPGFEAPIVSSITVLPDHLSGNHQISLSVDHVSLFTQIFVQLGDDNPVSYTATGTSTTIGIGTGLYGPKDIQVWGADYGSNRSVAVRAFTFMPRPQPGEIAASTPSLGDPLVTGMTVFEQNGARWILVIDGAGAVWRYDENLAAGEQVYPQYQGSTSLLSFVNQGIPRGVTQVDSSLYWLVETPNGHELQSTSTLFTAATFIHSVNEGYGMGGIVTFKPGDLAARGNNQLIIADRSIAELCGTQYRTTNLNGDLADDLTTMNPWRQLESGAVAWMETATPGLSDAMIVPFHDGLTTTGFVALSNDSTVQHVAETSIPGWTLALAYLAGPHTPAAGSASLYATVLNHNSTQGLYSTIYRIGAPRGTTPEYDVHHAAHGAVRITAGSVSLNDSTMDAPASTTVTITEAMTVGDVELVVDLTPESTGYFGAALISPEGTRVQLEGRVYLDKQTVLHFDDLGSGDRDDLAGNRRSSELLSAFDGQSAAGEWKIELHSFGESILAESVELRIAPLSEPYAVPRGDLDYDGDVDSLDLVFMEFYLLDFLPILLSPEVYDLDGDGDIDEDDKDDLTGIMNNSGLPVCSPDVPNDLGSVYPGYCP